MPKAPGKNKLDTIDKAALKNIVELIGLQNQLNQDIDSDIYGTVSHTNDSDSTKSKIASLVSQQKQNLGGTFFDSIDSMSKDFNATEQKSFERIKESIENNQNVSMFQNMINSNDTASSKYEDLMLVTSIMPQLKQAKKAIVNSILSPDDFTKQISLNMTIDNKSINTVDSTLSKTINSALKKYKFTKNVKYAIDRTVTFGSYGVAVLPYSKLFKQLLNKKNGNNMSSTNGLFSEDVILSEDSIIGDNIKDISKLKGNIKEILNNITITNESANLFDEEVLLSEYKKLNNEKPESIFDLAKLYKTATADSKSNMYSKSDFKQPNISTASDGMYTKEDLDKNDINITGCKLKKLDPRRLLALDVDEDTCLGYYYFENNETKSMIRNPGMFSFKNGTSTTNAQATVDTIYKTIGNLIWKKLDHKFVENHADIKERLYDILKYSDVNNDSKLKITFLEADEVVKFEINNGESAFESALFFARLYLMVLMSTITARVVRAADVRAYYVDVESDGGVNSMIYNAIDTLQKSNKSILSMNHITKMISNYSVFEDIFVPKSKDDKRPIDFDIISGQNIDMNTDLLELLEQICVNSTGVPILLLQNSNDVDFARTFTMMNMAYMKDILDKQTDINPSVTELIIKIMLTEVTTDEDKNKIRNLEANLQSPMNLLLTNILEQLNNAKDVAQNVVDAITGQNGTERYGDNVIDGLMLEVIKIYAPNVPWDDYIALLEKLKIDNKKDESDKAAETGGDDTETDV